MSARPYPRAVSGTPLEFDFDYPRRAFDLRYSSERAGGHGRFHAGSVTEVFLPRLHYRDGYAVEARGARVVSRAGADVLRLESCPGAKRMRVQVRPGKGSSSGCGHARPDRGPADGDGDEGAPGSGGAESGSAPATDATDDPTSGGWGRLADGTASRAVDAAGTTGTTSPARLPLTGLGFGTLLAVAAALIAAGTFLRRRFGGKD